MTRRPCLGCGDPTDGSRCDACSTEHGRGIEAHRGSRHDRGYGTAWTQLSKRAVRLSPLCQDCGQLGSTEGNPLTSDHLVWPARTLADVEVVCRRCNSRRGPTRGDAPRRERSVPATKARSRSHSLLIKASR